MLLLTLSLLLLAMASAARTAGFPYANITSVATAVTSLKEIPTRIPDIGFYPDSVITLPSFPGFITFGFTIDDPVYQQGNKATIGAPTVGNVQHDAPNGNPLFGSLRNGPCEDEGFGTCSWNVAPGSATCVTTEVATDSDADYVHVAPFAMISHTPGASPSPPPMLALGQQVNDLLPLLPADVIPLRPYYTSIDYFLVDGRTDLVFGSKNQVTARISCVMQETGALMTLSFCIDTGNPFDCPAKGHITGDPHAAGVGELQAVTLEAGVTYRLAIFSVTGNMGDSPPTNLVHAKCDIKPVN